MSLLIPFIIIVEIIGGIIAVLPPRHDNVLGESDQNRLIAQAVDTPTPTPESIQTPTDTPIPNPTDTPATLPTDTLTPIPGTATAEPSPQLSPTGTVTETVTPELSPSEQPSGQPEETISPSETPEETKPAEAVIFKDVTSTLPSETISKQSKEETRIENEALDQAETPDEKADLLVQFGNTDVQDITSNTQQNNENEVDFHVDKLNSHLDQIQETLQQQPAQPEIIKQQVTGLCQNAEPVLRQEALIVPDDTEQTIDIIRGKCFNYTQ